MERCVFMYVIRRFATALALSLVLVSGQEYERPGTRPRVGADEDPKLPDGRSQRDAILKAEHEKSLKDAEELVKLTEDLRSDLQNNDSHVLSVATLKKLDDIEKVTRRIRGRMKRY
jgi:hypothetical protein